MSRRLLQSLLILLLVGTARAQLPFDPGVNPQSDYLRAMGMAALLPAMGSYNRQTAQANQTNAQTFIMLNEYMWDVVKNEMRENAEHRQAILTRHAESYQKILERIHDHPEITDLNNGDALNAVLADLLAPNVSDSASRYTRIPLGADVVRRIPFKMGEKGEKFSMGRLSLKGTKKWAVAFQDPEFAPYRESYLRAVDNALELATEGDHMPKDAIKAIEKAVDDLEEKFNRTPNLRDPRHQRLYSEAKDQLDKMRGTARLFMTHKLQVVFREIDTYAGTTVDELRLFMQRHGLTFAPAETSDERELYPQLYTALDEHRRATIGPDQPAKQ